MLQIVALLTTFPAGLVWTFTRYLLDGAWKSIEMYYLFRGCRLVLSILLMPPAGFCLVITSHQVMFSKLRKPLGKRGIYNSVLV